MTIRRHVWASGQVQGVWFRDSCAREALAVGVNGWVRNLSDGRVEAVFEGPPPAVDALVDWCRHGPPRADVEQLEVVSEAPAGETRFAIR
jgi:acylphosphatase